MSEPPPSPPPEDPPPAPTEDPPPSPSPEDPPQGPPEDPPPSPSPEDPPQDPPENSPPSPSPENPPPSPYPEDLPPAPAEDPPADPPLASTPPSSSSTPSPGRPSLPGSPTPPLGSNSGGGGVSTGLVVGLVIGGLAIIVVVSLLFLCWCKKRKQRDDEAGNYTPPSPHAPKVDPDASRQNAPHPESHVIVTQSPVFTYEELVWATDGFSDANLLGQGSFGYVFKGVLPNGKEVAVKQLKAESRQGEREFQAEFEIISRLHHKHLVSLVGYSISGSQKLLVYEFVPNNTLWFHLHGKKDRPAMDWPTRIRIALGSAKGLAYLHEDCHPNIIHRDIKATNILLDFKFEAKVADFGLAKFFPDVNTHVSTRVMGTFGYLAPEYASTGKLTEKSDVFSFGVMLLELITGHPPIPSTNTSMEGSLVDWARPLLNRAIEGGNLERLVDPKLQNEFNHNEMTRMVACAAACVRHSPRQRPRMSQIVRTFEGDISVADLNEGIRPGQSSGYHSYESSDYYNMQYKEDFWKMALSSQGYGTTSEASEYGLQPSGSSSEGQNTQEGEMKNMKKHS